MAAQPRKITLEPSETAPSGRGSWSRLLGLEHMQILAHGTEESSPTSGEEGGGEGDQVEVDLCDFLGVMTAASHPTTAATVTMRGCVLGVIACACLPNLARVCCPSLAPFIAEDDDEEQQGDESKLCTSGDFFGNGAL